MPDRTGNRLPDWVTAELKRLAAVSQDEKLQGMWAIQARHDREGDPELKVSALKSLLDLAWKEARFDYTVKAFGELKRLYASSDKFADLRDDVLWYYKWIVERLPEHADIPRATIDKMFDEMEAFYRAEGESLRPVYSHRCVAAVLMGHKSAAEEWFGRWQAEKEGESDDCAACEADREIVYFSDREEREKALERGMPVATGKLWCGDSPATLALLIPLLYETGKRPAAFALQRASERMVRHSAHFLPALSIHLITSILAGNIPRSRRLAVLVLLRAKASHSDMHRFAAYRSVFLWASFATMIGALGDTAWTLKRKLLPHSSGEDPVSLIDVASTCLVEARRIASRLDARNETSRFTDRLDQAESQLKELLSKTSPRA